MAHHIFDITSDQSAAERRMDEMDTLIGEILGNPFSGTRLSGDLEGCIVRHGGRDSKLRIIFEPLSSEDAVFFIMASFGGEDWKAGARMQEPQP
jgi:hypothetical protein